MIRKRETTEFEKEVFMYLNALRKSGITNMFGAGLYVKDEFGISSRESTNLLLLWMKNFNDEGNYETIKTT